MWKAITAAEEKAAEGESGLLL